MSSTAKQFEQFLSVYLGKYGVKTVEVEQTEEGIDIKLDGRSLLIVSPPDMTRDSMGAFLERTTESIVRKLTGGLRMRTLLDLSDAELLDLFETSVRGRNELSEEHRNSRDGTITALRESVLDRMKSKHP